MVYVSGKGSPEEVNDPCIKEWLDSGKTDQPDTGSFNRVLLAWVIAGLSIILALGIYVYRRRKGLNRKRSISSRKSTPLWASEIYTNAGSPTLMRVSKGRNPVKMLLSMF